MRIYKLKSAKISGTIYFVYSKDELRTVEFDLKASLTDVQKEYIRSHLPFNVAEIGQADKLNLQEVNVRSVAEKLLAFCAAYKEYRGVAYRAKKLEKANVKDVPVNESLLQTFFTCNAWWVANNYTLSNYIKRINNIQDTAKNGQYVKPEFPDRPDANLERTLTPDAMQRYRQHLHKLGWKQVHSSTAGSSWKKEN